MSEIKRLAEPEWCPGGYSLHLYCDHENPAHGFREFPWEITEHETGPASRAVARRAGWVLHRDGTATCPKCVQALRGVKLPPQPDEAREGSQSPDDGRAPSPLIISLTSPT